MADVNKTIEVIFGAVDSTKAGLNSALDGYDTFDKKIQSVAGTGADFTASLLKAEIAIAAVGVAMTGVAINEAGQFGDAVLEIGTLFQGTHDQVATFNDDIIDFGRNSTQSLADITAATYTAISAGTDFNDSLALLAVTEKLAVAGVADLESATRLVASSLNAYGLEVDQAERFSDALFTTVKLGQTTIPELASSLASVTGVASSAGIPFETLTAAVAALTATGVPTSEAITSIKAAITNIIKPTKDAEDVAKALGVEFNATALQTKGFDGVLAELFKATGGNTEQMAKFFGSVTGLNAALVLSKDSSGKFAAALKEMETKAGATQIAFEAMEKAFSLVNQKLVNNIKATLIDSGKPLLAEYGDAVTAIAHLFEGLGDSVTAPEFQPVYDALNGFVDEFSKALEGIATALPEAMANVDFEPLIASFSSLGEEVGLVFDALFGDDLDLTKPEDLAKALQQAVNIIGTFVNLTKGIISEFKPIFEAIGLAAKELATTNSASSESAGNLLGALTVLSTFGTELGGFLVLINNSKLEIESTFNSLAGAAGIVVNGLQIVFDSFANVIAGVISIVSSGLSAVTFGETSKEWQKTADDWKLIAEGANENFEKNLGEMGDSWTKLVTGVSSSGGEAKESIKSLGDEAGEAAPKLGDAADGADNFADQLLNLEILDKVSKSLADVNQALDENGNAIDLPVQKTGELVVASKELSEVQKTLAEAMGLVNPSFNEFKQALDGLPIGVQNSVNATDDLAKKTEILEAAQKGMLLEFKDGEKVFTGYGTVMQEKATDKTKELTEETDKAKQAMLDFAVEMEKIASNERIKTIEFAVDFNIAQVEADAKKYAAALESVATVAAAISESIGTLAGIFASDDIGRIEQRFIEELIENQEGRLDQELELQEKLINAQIDQMNAQTEALNNGESLITIEAGGLEPELEAFMFKILQRIQVKVAADKDLFLANAGF